MEDLAPPGATMPPPSGEIGLHWAAIHTDVAQWGSNLTLGPAGWIYSLYDDGGFPTPHFMLSRDLETWDDVRPKGDAGACSGPADLAASRAWYLMLCQGLWRSVDGRSWESVKSTFVGGAPPPDGLRSLASDGRAFLGWTGSYPATDGIWTSPDGAAWTKVRLPGGPQLLIDAVLPRSTGGFLIAGRVAQTAEELHAAVEEFHTLPGRQALWSSDDGSTWNNLGIDEAFDGARIMSVHLDGPGGGVVAMGVTGAQESTRVAALWRSEDMVAWQHLVVPGIDLTAVEPLGIGVLATPRRWILMADPPDRNAIGVVAGSEDGRSWWTTVPIRLEPSQGSYKIIDDVLADDRLVALGELISPAHDDEHTRIWISPPDFD